MSKLLLGAWFHLKWAFQEKMSTKAAEAREQYLGLQSSLRRTGRSGSCGLTRRQKMSRQNRDRSWSAALRGKTHFSQRAPSRCRPLCDCQTPATARPREVRFIFFGIQHDRRSLLSCLQNSKTSGHSSSAPF